MDNSISLINEFLDKVVYRENWYENIKDDLKAVIFYGSRAKGTLRPDSDIDLLFIGCREYPVGLPRG